MNKFKKTAMRKQQTSNQTENSQAAEKDIMEGEQCGALLVFFSFHSSLNLMKWIKTVSFHQLVFTWLRFLALFLIQCGM